MAQSTTFYERRRSEGRCINCNKPTMNTRCPECTEKNRTSSREGMAKLNAKRREAGLCVQCGKNPTGVGGPWRCEVCSEKRRRREKMVAARRARKPARRSNEDKPKGTGEA